MDQKNLLLAIVASVAILFGFQYLSSKFLPAPPPPAKSTAQTTPAQPAPGTAPPGPAAEAPTGGTAPVGAASQALAETREAAIAEQPRVKIDTPRLHGSIALTGGRIDDLTLATYHETIDPKSPEVVLLWPTGTADPYFAEFGWIGTAPDVKLPGSETKWSASGGPLAPGHPVTLSWDNGAGLTFTRAISIDENYMFTVEDGVKNAGSAPVSLTPYGLISRTGTPPVSGYYILFEGPIGFLEGGLQEVKYTSLTPEKPADFGSTGGWLGFTDKYWLTALIPPQTESVKAQFRHAVGANNVDRYQADYTGVPVSVPAGGEASTSTRFFAGAKEVGLLDAYANSGIPRFDRAIDFGWFYFLTKPIFLVLVFFHGLLGNFGLAILVLTFLIKLAFFPLANKSYAAMSKMKLLQPEVAKAREKYPDDKAKQQQEIMALYKKVGANPLAGCLPIVIQIPVFFSLYKVLFVTIEMRHAPFFGWIHDLSAPDPTSFANLFGLLPFDPLAVPMVGHFLAIGAWPLLMGITMFLQQKLNPQPVDPVQARMFMFLPIVFTYMLSAFPAGLVIYWSWNNLLSIAQQWAIMHRRGAA
ncbi:MAG TPA: membrane protein insertase YidC [Stellaceae bacterium]|jgi:YidC/Oxa1 family membrane protein insertase|nr:membrane protein insertase YidC [Stellaceae bacterium]